ncbi:conserved hypothetical protein [Thiomonas arsenitoxydans]|uniref:Uncharacterized protein n=1 Tax=Thiomonas arsenitoxydans (strain DSM 22701 / CIP 110005 / 3As) TaxID=426114 RepID=D6CUK4_THIA3|nr:hypothetical protein THI_2335 [Thiomonas arsenitoxydans]VDY06702.1 conserved protein of unknown function [Thiomonas sp. Bio17B3]VDY10004.1 conserved protein of unknown function [Thiomonas sp. Sup16B3]VDY14976.1 hypothetical protein TOC7_31406 [Thiomonas sp. OC7]CQR29612.1 conserved hypothetical protein [Thiomonas arsenitoxydans]
MRFGRGPRPGKHARGLVRQVVEWRSFEIAPEHVSKLLGRVGSHRILALQRLDKMALDMFLDNLAEQSIESAAATGDDMQHLLAPGFRLKCALDGVDLPPDTTHPVQQLGFLADGMAHIPMIAYPPIR